MARADVIQHQIGHNATIGNYRFHIFPSPVFRRDFEVIDYCESAIRTRREEWEYVNQRERFAELR